jgi:hypothetical protein
MKTSRFPLVDKSDEGQDVAKVLDIHPFMLSR